MKPTQVAAAFLFFAATATAGASAQDVASTFDQLRVLLKSGDRITVIDAAGRATRGRVDTLSPSSLALLADGARRQFAPTEVNAIRQRKSDSLATGAKVGFAIGAGLGLFVGLALAPEVENDAAFAILTTLVYGGMGAGVGVAVDALITREQVIFARPGSSVRNLGLALKLTF